MLPLGPPPRPAPAPLQTTGEVITNVAPPPQPAPVPLQSTEEVITNVAFIMQREREIYKEH